ncbi:MAG: hypothetical protein Q9164_007196 [Protoblastenia rupestris]
MPALVFVDIDTAVTKTFFAFALHADQERVTGPNGNRRSSPYFDIIGLPVELNAAPPITPDPIALGVLNGDIAAGGRTAISADRPNLAYCMQSLPPATPDEIGYRSATANEDALVDEAVEICEQDIEQWSRFSKESQHQPKGLCFVRTRAIGLSLARKLNCHLYHGNLLAVQRDGILKDWFSNRRSPFLIATRQFRGMTDFAKQVDRAGRDGLHATFVTILPPRWRIIWKPAYRNDFLIEDERYMKKWLESRVCHRQQLTFFLDGSLDGRTGTACKELDGIERALCDNCVGAPGLLAAPNETGSAAPLNPLEALLMGPGHRPLLSRSGSMLSEQHQGAIPSDVPRSRTGSGPGGIVCSSRSSTLFGTSFEGHRWKARGKGFRIEAP